MTTRRVLAAFAVGVLAATAAACSDEQSSADSVGSSTSSSTSVASTTTTTSTVPASSTTSSTTSPTSTTSTSTTTTLARVKGLALSSKGLGDALFGADADGVVDYVSSILGAPNNDSGWADPLTIGAPCPGTQIRFVDWDDLSLFFSDNSPAAVGLRHFAAYTYGPAFVPGSIKPFGLATDRGLSVGSSVADLIAAYPSAVVGAGDEISGPAFFIEDGLVGFLTAADPATGSIISFVGGYGCGE
jgi:hypothetical protein